MWSQPVCDTQIVSWGFNEFVCAAVGHILSAVASVGKYQTRVCAVTAKTAAVWLKDTHGDSSSV
jgi:hypothetical protein